MSFPNAFFFLVETSVSVSVCALSAFTVPFDFSVS